MTFPRWLRDFGSKPPTNRRQSPRKPFAAAIEVRTVAGTTFRGVARDLSECGMGAIVYADLSVGDSVVVHYEHPRDASSHLVRRSACVRGRYGSRYGFEFEGAISA
ncbi:MAG: PilZ domain-containing protein [Terriglobales bacterium]